MWATFTIGVIGLYFFAKWVVAAFGPWIAIPIVGVFLLIGFAFERGKRTTHD